MYRAPAVDRCPGALRLHEAADGALARVRLPGGRLPADGLDALAGLAARGNGLVELTSRAGVQLRGLRADDGAAVAAALRGAGLLPSAAHDRVRNVLAPPLGARHPGALADGDRIVTALDAGLCAEPRLAELPGRFLFAVDDGSGTLAPHRADVLLAAGPSGGLRLTLAGRPTTLAAGDEDAAAALALRAARAFLALLQGGAAADGPGGRTWRIADLPDGAAQVAAALGGSLTEEAGTLPGTAPGVGRLPQRDGRVAVTVLAPLGRVDAAALVPLAALARESAGGDVRVGPDRTLTLVDVAAEAEGAVLTGLATLGFVTAAGSGWEGLSACAGAGACASARLDVRSAARTRAATRARQAAPPASEHWAACERGCGARTDAVLVRAQAGGGLTVARPGDAGAWPAADVGAVLDQLASAGAQA